MAETKKPIENEFQKARVLFEKGLSEYNKNNFAEALNYFNASFKLNPEDSTQIYIKRCKKSIVNNSTHDSNTGKKSTPNVHHNKTQHHEKERSKSTPVETEQDRECLKVIRKKDYYDILEVSKNADENEIKKAYKKLAIKYHPDKNQSKHTEEAFKKISHAFTTLKDPEKKKLYDLYGSEEEIRERQAQQQAHYHYQQEDVDPFDLFEMFFNGGSFQHNGNFRRRANRNAPQQHHHQNQRNANEEGNVRVNKYAFLFQLLPLILIFLLSVVPSIFQSRPYYQFSRDEEFYKRMTTSYNSVNYYVGDKFINAYNKINDIRKMEYNVERDYLNFVAQKCNQAMQYKQDLEYKLSYYRHSNYYVKIKQELDNLDLSKCKEYYRLKNVVR